MATAEISAKEVFKLRKQTGAGMIFKKKRSKISKQKS